MPFSFQFRLSNEELYSGRPSYFRLSYNPIQKLTNNLSDLESKLAEIESKINDLQVKKSAFDQKISYQNTLLSNQKYKTMYYKLDTASIQNPSTPSIPSIPSVGMGFDSLNPIHGIDTFSLNYSKTLEELASLQLKKSQLEEAYLKELNKYQKPTLNSIKKLDFGLTSLPESSVSGNAIPIHGISMAMERERYYASISSGVTMRNQLFSNQLFDQIIYNNYNVFNQNDLFFVEKLKWISSSIVGLGKQNGHFIQLETTQVGSTYSTKLKRIERSNSITNNIVFQRKIRSLVFKGGVGYSFRSDSTGRSSFGTNQLLYFGDLEYVSKKGHIQSELNYRKMPSEYESWAIGINTRASEKLAFRHHHKLTKRWIVTLRGSIDRFVLTDSLNTSLSTRQIGFNQQIKLSKKIQAYSDYTLLQIARSSDVKQGINHLGKLGMSYTKSTKKASLLMSGDVSYAQLNSRDSIGELIQITNRVQIKKGLWRFGNEISWSESANIGNFTGSNLVVKPFLFVEKGTFYFGGSLSRLWSEQFGQNTGGEVKIGYWFDAYYGIEAGIRYFLPTDFILFYLSEKTLKHDPFITNIKMKFKIP